jgi:hypothetical protein
MAKTKISEWSATPANNTDIDGINLAEGCAPSGINDAIREMMAQVKDLYAGTSGDATAVAGGGTGATTASAARANLGLAIGTDVQAYNANLTAYGATGIGFRNRIINGDMRIDQRNAGASGTASAYTVDRWSYYGSQASKATWQQNAGAVTPPVGFTNYLGATSSSAYSITSTDQFLLNQKIEGLNFGDLAWGTASAQTATLSFWVRSSLTGTFGGSIQNSAANRCYPFSFVISAANTWEQKTVTIAGDTTGTWLTTNGIGAGVNFSLGTGATYSSAAGSWTGSSFITSATGATSVVGTSGATFYVTGVQLEAGSVASPFERRDYGRELMMCQRYCTDLTIDCVGYQVATGAILISMSLPTTMRTTPTITQVANNVNYSQSNVSATTSLYIADSSHITAYRLASTTNSSQFSEVARLTAEL